VEITPGGSTDVQVRPLFRVMERPSTVSAQPDVESIIVALRTFGPGVPPSGPQRANVTDEHELGSAVATTGESVTIALPQPVMPIAAVISTTER
jgi:hypothetical protein